LKGKGISVSLSEIICMERLQNFQRVKDFFFRKLAEMGYDGAIGVAGFKKVYDELMSIQKSRLREICGEQFHNLLKDGSIDKDSWNIYAKEYHKINRFLNAISEEITDFFGGIPIPATVEDIDVRICRDSIFLCGDMQREEVQLPKHLIECLISP